MRNSTIWLQLFLMGCFVVPSCTSFSLPSDVNSSNKKTIEPRNIEKDQVLPFPRRDFLSVVSISAATLVSTPMSSKAEGAPEAMPNQEGGVTMYKTVSGLKYIELAPAKNPNAPTPRYGQLCILSYKASLKLPNEASPQKFDEAKDFIVSHGNGKMIPGLDEGLHTMKLGSTRRLIIPPKLGFVDIGLGPLPEYPWNRSKLSKLLDQMVEQQGGNLVYDVTLTKIFDNEADQGYYEDESLSPEEFAALQQNLRLKNLESSQQQQGAKSQS
jgi:FKBP-type peptidyl-prolyl cis-trans isomerase